MKTSITISLELERREFVLITKGLSGTLRPEEIEEAQKLGYALMKQYSQSLEIKIQASLHALDRVSEETGKNHD